MRGSCRAFCSMSRANTTAAAGAPPMTHTRAPSQRNRLEVLVEALGEDHEGAAMQAGDDAEDDRPVEVHDRAPDLGAELELPFAHRFRRAVEPDKVGEHHECPAPAGRVYRAGDLLGRAREQRA